MREHCCSHFLELKRTSTSDAGSAFIKTHTTQIKNFFILSTTLSFHKVMGTKSAQEKAVLKSTHLSAEYLTEEADRLLADDMTRHFRDTFTSKTHMVYDI